MSNDSVDDLHAAEDFAGMAVAALERLLAAIDFQLAYLRADLDPLAGARSNARGVVGAWGFYCRPTCGAEGDPDSDECDDDTCGCPCGHTEED